MEGTPASPPGDAVSAGSSELSPLGDADDSSPASRRSRSSAPPGYVQGMAATWEENTATCSICGIKIGKRHLTPRHHCRLCGRCVCAGCSPNTVELSSHRGKRRACKECLVDLERTSETKGRLWNLASRLYAFCGQAVPAMEHSTVDSTILACEEALGPFERQHERHRRSEEKLRRVEAEMQSAKSASIRLNQRIHSTRRTQPPGTLQAASLTEALALCEQALAPDGAQQARAGEAPAHEADGEAARLARDGPHGARRADAPQSDPGCDLRAPLRAAMDDEEGQREVSVSGRRHRRGRCVCCFARAFATLVVLAALAFAAYRWAIPAFGQLAMDAATVTLASATLSAPSGSSVFMSAELVLHSGYPLSAHVGSFNASISRRGRAFAYAIFPETTLAASGPTVVHLSNVMMVVDQGEFTSGARSLMQGNSDEWSITGSPRVTSFRIGMDLDLRKTIAVPGILLEDMRSGNIDVMSGQDPRLFTRADTSFTSTSETQLRGFGRMVFLLHPVAANGTVRSGVVLGKVIIPDFEVMKGVNWLRNTSVVLNKEGAETAVAEYLSSWISGREQFAAISGPVESVSPLFRNVTMQKVRVAGLSQGLIRSAYVSHFHTLQGHSPKGPPCSLVAGERCLRGSVISIQNQLKHEIVLRNIVTDIDLDEDLSYETSLHMVGAKFKRVKCSKGKRLTRVKSHAGMWAYLNQSRKQDDTVPLASAPSSTVPALSSMFLVGSAQPGQGDGSACLGIPALDPNDCCFTTIMTAAACRAKQRSQNIITTNLRGNATVVIDGFEITAHVEQQGVPVTYANDIPSFRVGPVTTSCSDFRFF